MAKPKNPLNPPGGTFNDPDLYITTEDARWLGPVVLAKVMRRSRPLSEAFLIAWNSEKIGKRFAPEEHEEQAVFVSVAKAGGALVHSVPNGGFRDLSTAQKMKREGMSPGAPDLIVLGGTPLPGIIALPIIGLEFKRANGILSDISQAQLKWLENYHTKTCGHADGIVVFGNDAGLAALEFRGYAVPRRGTPKASIEGD